VGYLLPRLPDGKNMNRIYYKNETSRLKNFDYGANGNYFITICTQNKKILILNGNMVIMIG
jgi:hypothetical protein